MDSRDTARIEKQLSDLNKHMTELVHVFKDANKRLRELADAQKKSAEHFKTNVYLDVPAIAPEDNTFGDKIDE